MGLMASWSEVLQNAHMRVVLQASGDIKLLGLRV